MNSINVGENQVQIDSVSSSTDPNSHAETTIHSLTINSNNQLQYNEITTTHSDENSSFDYFDELLAEADRLIQEANEFRRNAFGLEA